MVEKLKRLFIAFELKMNFAKSKIILLNLSSTQAHHFAQILGYKLGKILLKYLG
jgi:hypothetical protein